MAYDETADVTAFRLAADSTLDSTCSATSGTVAESGKLAYTDNLGSAGTESMDIFAANPLMLTWIGGQSDDTYTISGTVSMVCPCFTGSFTLVTTAAMFIPTNGECPTAGEVLVSGDINGTVVHTSTGGLDIKDGTGAVVKTYTSCNEAQACL